ncbi:MAG: SPFH domain-containing protein [Bacteroidales bacterium]|nr:SPFH domain-containing protein [Bacteroidales bacterium]
MENKDFEYKGLKVNGFVALFAIIAWFAATGYLLVSGINEPFGAIMMVIGIICATGFVMNEPNQSKALLFFGKYCGSFRQTGWYWLNPLLTKKPVSLRARNLNGETIKVNDKNGNPILIGLVLVWKVSDVYKALFEIDSATMAAENTRQTVNSLAKRMAAFENFVMVQSDAALRQVAGQYAYDSLGEEKEELTLRAGSDEINNQLEEKLNQRLAMAGIEVVEARINYLAYAPEIAAVMLRRQQAEAIISAREKIVEGAVSMVKIALDKLSEQDVLELDDEKKAAMVTNLLVVLCGDEQAQPVVNTGTLYK